MKRKVLIHAFHKRNVPLRPFSALRILGIYAMDKLKRKDWDQFGNRIAQKGGVYTEKYGYEIFI
jgi:hypothetical protein